MQATGSRTTDTYDAFSDWDFQVDSAQDFPQIAAKIAEAAAWNIVKRGNLYIATIIDVAGTMWDYSGTDAHFDSQWRALGTPAAPAASIYDYWIIAFKHLKGLYRGYEQLGSVGIEMSTGLARDIYIAQKYGFQQYKNFYAYKQIAPVLEADAELKAVVGLPYRTADEMLSKLIALNRLVMAVSAEISQPAEQAFTLKVDQLRSLSAT